ncbi:MAG: hypothetical protein Q9223_005405 [Gallowayella weberi]
MSGEPQVPTFTNTAVHSEGTLKEGEITTTRPEKEALASVPFVQGYDQSFHPEQGPVDNYETWDLDSSLEVDFNEMPSDATTTDTTSPSSDRVSASNVVTGAASTHGNGGTSSSNIPENATPGSWSDSEDLRSHAKLRQDGIEAQDFAHHHGSPILPTLADPKEMTDDDLDALFEEIA